MKLTVNGKKLEAEEGKTILEVCRENNIYVPTLCYHPDLTPEARCRICVVDVGGRVMTACNTLAHDGMHVLTDNKEISKARKLNLELLLANHGHSLDEDNELVELAKKLGVDRIRGNPVGEKHRDESTYTLFRDNNKCILCGKCVQKCQEVQDVNAIGYVNRGFDTEIMPAFDHTLSDVSCINCGQCATVCPAGALTEKDDTHAVMAAIKDPSKHVIVQTAPAVRVAIGETQGLPPGDMTTGRMVAALRRLGFDRVLDTNFAADLTIIEEGSELLKRVSEGGVLPMITSCCPGWIKYIEHFYPHLLPHLSTCKSPHQMLGALIKTYYTESQGWKQTDIVSVSIMPCTAKKYEIKRPEMTDSGDDDVDFVLTTRELGRMFNNEGIRFEDLEDEYYDPVMGSSTGGAAIFGATGGVMEAALRFAADKLTGEDLEAVEYHDVRGLEGIKEATVEVAGLKIKLAVAHGLSNTRKLLDDLENRDYHFIEIMACPGGCVGGGGQPVPSSMQKVKQRTEGIYRIDQILALRKSQDNPEIQEIYRNFLGEPGGEKSHHLLHTHYTERDRFGNKKTKKGQANA